MCMCSAFRHSPFQLKEPVGKRFGKNQTMLLGRSFRGGTVHLSRVTMEFTALLCLLEISDWQLILALVGAYAILFHRKHLFVTEMKTICVNKTVRTEHSGSTLRRQSRTELPCQPSPECPCAQARSAQAQTESHFQVERPKKCLARKC